MISKFTIYKKEAVRLRKKGFTYGEIKKTLGVTIPKSTLTVWFSGLHITLSSQKRLDRVVTAKLKKAHRAALAANKKNRQKYWDRLENKILHLPKYLKGKDGVDIAKIILAVLYLGEGAKGKNRSFMLGNSDPKVIRLYIELLRKCYPIDESKFRCTLQCRADQDISGLENFWSKVTSIPLNKFYKAKVDPRTIGKKSKKPGYKGVCRIDYFSADIYNEIEKIIEVVCSKGL